MTQVLDRLTRMEYDNLLLRKKLLDLAQTEGDAVQIRRWAESVLQIDVADAEAHAALAGLTSGDGHSLPSGSGLATRRSRLGPGSAGGTVAMASGSPASRRHGQVTTDRVFPQMAWHSPHSRKREVGVS